MKKNSFSFNINEQVIIKKNAYKWKIIHKTIDNIIVKNS